MEEIQLLRPEDVARMLKVAKVTPYQWARRGVLPHYRLEGVIRFKGRDSGQIQIAKGFRRKGDLKEWSKIIPLIKDYPKVSVAAYASPSWVLNPILHAPNFVVDYASGTSSGKTTRLGVAASCSGNPNQNERDSIVRSWGATATWLERVSNVLKNLPFFIDDTQRAKGSDLTRRFK